ncbi:MarR family winged helix-turn-helix transcriptional regulator [Rubrobacter aplysinae]|uniref:MarR family winged helix-turn-helix transcriptional regulator n=1 Tax=Rubrobacter aplysinae TaxID=909625 RepID=UPI00069FEABA|nr:MarR family winged helix-turn-helix transcriptional regulator [Rubrobacter aplysinae]
MEREDGSFVLAPLNGAFKALLAAFERDVGVSGPRYFLLRVLVVDGGEDGLGQGEVCRRFRVDPSRVTRIAKAAEAEGLIRRVRDPADNRVLRLYPTDEGRRVYEEAALNEERFRSRVGEAVSQQDLEELRQTLEKLERAATGEKPESAREVQIEL